MKNRQIVFTKVNTAELLPCEMPVIGDHDVMVKIEVSTISSGTERANITGEVNIDIYSRSAVPVFPRYGGYSSAGVVLQVGKKVENLHEGDRVALSWSRHCRYIGIKASNVYKIEDSRITFQEAALTHIATFPLAAIRKCRLEIGEPAMVMGLGILGMIAVKELRAAGACPIIAVDTAEEKRKAALMHGADYAFDPMDESFPKKVIEASRGGIKVAIEATGLGTALNTALDCMARFGRVALLGCTRNSDFTVDYYRKVHGPGISLIGAHSIARPEHESSPGMWTQRDDAMTVLSLLAADRLSLIDLIEETHKPKEAPEVYKRLAESKAFPVTQFDWSGME
jgi:2-desacetyl-2-hydroxyethyl bacteriochlorophyllide A dehydrogenase